MPEPTIRLHGCSTLHQMISQLHSVSRTERQFPGQPNDQDTHKCILQDGHLRAEAQEEAGGDREGTEGYRLQLPLAYSKSCQENQVPGRTGLGGIEGLIGEQ